VSKPTDLRGLYAVTDPRLTPGTRLIAAAEAALRGGARLLQYRDKHADHTFRREMAAALADLCREQGALFIVNDDPELAAEVGADGVHLGREDPDIAAARACLGRAGIIGVSCYNDLDRARAAAAAGARTKPEAVPAHPDLLRAASAAIGLPLVAIGGITPENGRILIEAGADLLAVIHGLFGQPDIEAAARAFAKLFRDQRGAAP